MKKFVLIALITLLLLSYPATAWFFGKRIEETVAAQYESVKESPYVKLLSRDFQRGVYSSTETVMAEVFGDVAKSLPQAGTATAVAPFQPIKLTVTTVYKHGPVVDFEPVLAVAESSLSIDPSGGGAEIARILGSEPILLGHTVFDFSGGGTFTLSSKAFEGPITGDAGTVPLKWGGASAEVDFSSDLGEIRMHATAPLVALGGDQPGSVKLTEIRVDSLQKRIFADDPLLSSGRQSLAIAQIDALPKERSEPLSLAGFEFQAETPLSGEFMDLIGRISIKTLAIGQKHMGPTHFDYSLRHLNARKLSAFSHTLSDIYTDPAFAQQEPSPARLAPLLAPGIELLKDEPEFRLDRLSVATAEGEAILSARIRLDGTGAQDFDNPALLLAKANAAADLSVPAKVLDALILGLASSPDEAQVSRERLKQQVSAASQQGFIVEEGGVFKSRIAFARGQLTVNGRVIPIGAPDTSP